MGGNGPRGILKRYSCVLCIAMKLGLDKMWWPPAEHKLGWWCASNYHLSLGHSRKSRINQHDYVLLFRCPYTSSLPVEMYTAPQHNVHFDFNKVLFTRFLKALSCYFWVFCSVLIICLICIISAFQIKTTWFYQCHWVFKKYASLISLSWHVYKLPQLCTLDVVSAAEGIAFLLLSSMLIQGVSFWGY